jgi:hypothetical protein
VFLSDVTLPTSGPESSRRMLLGCVSQHTSLTPSSKILCWAWQGMGFHALTSDWASDGLQGFGFLLCSWMWKCIQLNT